MQLQQGFACVTHLLLLLRLGQLRDVVVQRIDERNVFERVARLQAEQFAFVFAAIFARAKGFAATTRSKMLKVKWKKSKQKKEEKLHRLNCEIPYRVYFS